MSFKDRFKLQEKEKQTNVTNFIRPDYQFHDNFNKQLSFEGINDNRGRYYPVPGGSHPLPSVTTVLSGSKSDEDLKTLENWKKRVGYEKAEKIKVDAANRGSYLHNFCENFILNKGNIELPAKNTNEYALLKQIYPLLLRINNIHHLEAVLYSYKLGVAGRVDCIAEFDGILSVIDFKTSTGEKLEKYLQDYYMQETAYALMYSEMFGCKVKQIVTLMAMDNDFHSPQGQVIIRKPINYVKPLVERIQKYNTLTK